MTKNIIDIPKPDLSDAQWREIIGNYTRIEKDGCKLVDSEKDIISKVQQYFLMKKCKHEKIEIKKDDGLYYIKCKACGLKSENHCADPSL